MSVGDVARGMRLSVRAYQRFESGETPAEVDRIIRFAEATDCDPAPLLCIGVVADPAISLRCADNKAMLVVLHAFEDFALELGEELRGVSAYDLMTATESALKRLAREQREKRQTTDRWLATRRSDRDDDTD